MRNFLLRFLPASVFFSFPFLFLFFPFVRWFLFRVSFSQKKVCLTNRSKKNIKKISYRLSPVEGLKKRRRNPEIFLIRRKYLREKKKKEKCNRGKVTQRVKLSTFRSRVLIHFPKDEQCRFCTGMCVFSSSSTSSFSEREQQKKIER